jgi:hypothetical protein
MYASGVVPVEKRGMLSSSARFGYPFQLTFRLLQKKDKTNISVVLTASSIYDHGNACFPTRAQLELANQEVPVQFLRGMV